jgi:RNA polymerase-binding transcription factor DksA
MTEASATETLTQLKLELEQRIERLASSVGRAEPLARDSGEQAIELENVEVKDELQREAQLQLILVNRALQRINDDQYGICIDCSKAVAKTRLEAIPYAERCIGCEIAQER